MRPGRGILLMILAVTLFTAMSACIKAADRIPAGEAVFFRSSLTLPIVLIWLGISGKIVESLRTTTWKTHMGRGVVGTTSMAMGFAGLHYLPLPEVTALQFVTPILVVVFAAVLLGERIRLIRISAVLTGLVGVVVILWPRLTVSADDGALFGAGLVLAAATLAAFAAIFVKSMAGRENPVAIVFYFALTATVMSFLTVPFGWVWPEGWEWALLIGSGLLGWCGQMVLTLSYRNADASVLAPFSYVSMIWSLLIGFFIFAETPTAPMLAGAALVIVSGVAIVLRERQLGKRTAAEGKVGAKRMQ